MPQNRPQSPLDRVLTSRLLAFAALGMLMLGAGCVTTLVPVFAPSATPEPKISAAFPFESKFVEVKGSKMHYVEVGEGAPVLLLHGNPTSSYLWRNVIPHLAKEGRRIIAPDLIGMGKSDKPDLAYRLADHVEYIDGFIQALELKNITLVLHDWGGGIGFDHAMRHEDNVRAIVFFEAVLRPQKWDEVAFPAGSLFKALRDPEEGDQLMLDENYFVEKLIPAFSGRELSPAEMEAYRAPYKERAHRKPTRVWPQEIPFDGQPADNHARMTTTYKKLQESKVPLLLLTAKPGAIFTAEVVEILKKDFPRMKVQPVGEGVHYLQETVPTAIGKAASAFIDTLPTAPAPSAEPVALGN